MQVLDRAGVGTLWSICKTKFALAGHTHSSVTDGTMTIYPMVNNEVNFGGSNNSEYYIAIGLLVKNDNMYFLTMGQNLNTFRIYKMHIPINSKVLPNIPDTYIKVK